MTRGPITYTEAEVYLIKAAWLQKAALVYREGAGKDWTYFAAAERAIIALVPAPPGEVLEPIRQARLDELRSIEAAWADDPRMEAGLMAIRNRIALLDQRDGVAQ